MKTKEFNKENVLDVLSGLHDSMSQLASEYCDDDYNAAVRRSVKMLERVINTISDMPVCVLYSDARKSFNDLLLYTEHQNIRHIQAYQK